jgi:DNA-binding NarL/FixJ family response regulator
MTADPGGPRVVILADDLIWQTRLASVLQALGAQVERTRTAADFEAAIAGAAFAIVDLTARAYQPISSIELANARDLRVLGVGQHDDLAQRKAALDAGAERVFAYRKLFEDGPATLRAWLEGDRPTRRLRSAAAAVTRATE